MVMVHNPRRSDDILPACVPLGLLSCTLERHVTILYTIPNGNSVLASTHEVSRVELKNGLLRGRRWWRL